MRTPVRTVGMLLAGALGFLLWSATAASADITNPSDPTSHTTPKTYLPPTPAPSETQPPSTPAAPSAPPASEEPAASPAPAATPAPVPAPSPAVEPVVSTPAPESVVTRAVRPLVREDRGPLVASDGETPFAAAIQAVRSTLDDLGTFLAEAASACKVGLGAGAGVPVLALAVLGTVTALTRRRALGTWWAADEETPEMLYAWDVIAPG